MTRDLWLTAHPYLQSVAELHAQVEQAVADCAMTAVTIPVFDGYLRDYHDGVPALLSASVVIDLGEVENMVPFVVTRLAAMPLPGNIAAQCRDLACARSQDAHSGLVRYVTWSLLGRYLRPVVRAFDQWRDEERWLRHYCPTCGEPPAMGQLVGKDPGRLRLLSCACCRTRWRYRRTGCPFCDRQHNHRLAILAVEEDSGLRIDYCDACGGYLKTYSGEGSEHVLLADWASLHLDVIARDRGLKRLAASLYEL